MSDPNPVSPPEVAVEMIVLLETTPERFCGVAAAYGTVMAIPAFQTLYRPCELRLPPAAVSTCSLPKRRPRVHPELQVAEEEEVCVLCYGWRRARQPGLLIIGASATVRWAMRKGATADPWLSRMLSRKPPMLVIVALANKTSRIVWGLMVKGGTYRTPALAG